MIIGFLYNHSNDSITTQITNINVRCLVSCIPDKRINWNKVLEGTLLSQSKNGKVKPTITEEINETLYFR